MRLLAASLQLAVWALLAPAVRADFWLSEWDRAFTSGYVFTAAHPQYCTPELGSAPEYWGLNDVSGDKLGVRFEGVWDDPEIVEFNTLELGHHTIYKDRGYQIYDLDDKVKGKCVVDRHWEWDCVYKYWDHFTGTSLLQCTSEDLHL